MANAVTADGKKTLEDVESGAKVALPPVDWSKKNPFKALFFAQVTPLIAEGTVRRLEPTDLCHLDALDSDRVRIRFRQRARCDALDVVFKMDMRHDLSDTKTNVFSSARS